jgi:glycosyltransferase involved in cell wall biosynthesis
MPSDSTDRTTVVVITHNYAQYLRDAVESTLAQTRRPAVLIMDDASEDETESIVQQLLRRAGSRLAYHRAPINQGLSRTRNRAAGMASTDWIIYLDADDWLAGDYVEKGEDWLDRHPRVDVLTTDMFIVRDRRRPRVFRARIPRSWDGLLRANTIVQTSFLRRQIVGALGGYDADLDYEDWDFWIRTLKSGYRIGRLPGAHVYRREHGLNKSKICDVEAAETQVRLRHPLPGR